MSQTRRKMMGEIARLQLTDDTDIEEVVALLDDLYQQGYTTEEIWSEGQIGIRRRENQTLEEST
jgi:hypothetical protein